MYWPYFWLTLLASSFIAIPVAHFASQAAAKKAFRQARERMQEAEAEARDAEAAMEHGSENAIADL
jgi:Ni/Co efflux regulator RcnB